MPFSPTVVPVNIPGTQYDIQIAFDLLRQAGPIVAELTAARTAAIVTDSHVGPLAAGAVEQSLAAAGFRTVTATIPAGENHKSIEYVLPIYDQLLSAKIERATPVIALGGGVIGDMAGFVAGTILRGVPFIQIPTSLLAMVDASVGGKTGVNHRTGKNLIGVFHQPRRVLIDPNVLRTLPPRELRGGLAECIKHDIIRDAEGFASLEKNIARALTGDLVYIAELVAHNVAIKARVVAADPHEKGERAHLNFGHTFGHAIEKISNYSYGHGEAVALGMVAAARCAQSLDMLDGQSVERIINVIRNAGLPVGGMTLDTTAVVEAMAYDKKVERGKVRFVLPDRIGHVVIRDDIPVEKIAAAVASLRDE